MSMGTEQNIDELVLNAEIDYFFREAGVFDPDYIAERENLAKPSLNELSMMQVAETLKDLSKVERENILENYSQNLPDLMVDPINPDYK